MTISSAMFIKCSNLHLNTQAELDDTETVTSLAENLIISASLSLTMVFQRENLVFPPSKRKLNAFVCLLSRRARWFQWLIMISAKDNNNSPCPNERNQISTFSLLLIVLRPTWARKQFFIPSLVLALSNLRRGVTAKSETRGCWPKKH